MNTKKIQKMDTRAFVLLILLSVTVGYIPHARAASAGGTAEEKIEREWVDTSDVRGDIQEEEWEDVAPKRAPSSVSQQVIKRNMSEVTAAVKKDVDEFVQGYKERQKNGTNSITNYTKEPAYVGFYLPDASGVYKRVSYDKQPQNVVMTINSGETVRYILPMLPGAPIPMTGGVMKYPDTYPAIVYTRHQNDIKESLDAVIPGDGTKILKGGTSPLGGILGWNEQYVCAVILRDSNSSGIEVVRGITAKNIITSFVEMGVFQNVPKGEALGN